MCNLKICTKCNLEKDIKYFDFRSDTKKYRNHCKQCHKGYLESKEDKQNKIKELFTKGKKECSKCKVTKPIDEFNNDKFTVTGKSSNCKECINSKYTKLELRDFAYKTKYGITLSDYNNLYEIQKGCCDICNQPFEQLVVDHCHNTGNVRGLLCNNCNFGLGFFKDSISNLEKASKYILKHKH
jgi:hypothetical protein